MKGRRFTEEQIIGVLKEADAGAKTKDLCRKHGISEATFYNWKAKYGGMTVSEARRLRELEAENSKLKRLLAEAELDKAALKDWNRECLAIEVDTSITGRRVVGVLERLADLRGLPASITVDHGPEFEGQVLDAWAYQRGVRLSFIRPGKPVENAYIESFNGKFRDECLNEHWFVTLAQARRVIETWRIEYNTERPHSSLGDLPPTVFAQRRSASNEESVSLTADSSSAPD